MKTASVDRCDVCGAPAAVLMRGSTLCARCGLDRSLPAQTTAGRRGRKAAFFALFSGLLAKLLAGTVALAAVGGVAVTVLAPDHPEMSPAVASGDLPDVSTTDNPFSSVAPDLAAIVDEAEREADNAKELAAKMQEWARCVSEQARKHSDEGFNALAACPRPRPEDFGLGTEAGSDAPVHAGGVRGDETSSDAPGRTGEVPGGEEPADEAADPGRPAEVDGPSKNDK